MPIDATAPGVEEHPPQSPFEGGLPEGHPPSLRATPLKGGLPEGARASVDLQVRVDSLDEAARTVEAVLSTERVVRVMDWQRYEIIDEVLLARGAKLPVQVPLLDTHFRGKVGHILGSVRALRVEGNQIVGRLNFATTDEAGPPWTLAREGHLTDVSVGYRLLDAVTISAGQTGVVDGVEYTAGERTLRVVRSWEPFECSVCPIGADQGAKLRQEVEAQIARAATKEATAMPEKVTGAPPEEAQRTHEPAETPAAQSEGTRSAPPRSETNPMPGVIDLDAVRAETVAKERARVRAIHAAACDDIPPDVVERAIADGLDETAARAMFLDSLRASRGPSAGTGRVDVVGTGAEELVRTLGDAILLEYGGRVENPSPDASRFRGIGIQEMARQCLQAEGVRAPLGQGDLLRSAVSTNSFPELLSGSATKSLMQAFNEYPDTTEWLGKRRVRDFKEYTDIKMSEFSSLSKVGHGGEMDFDTLAEQPEKYRIDTYGKRFALTRQMWINDDLSAFLRIPMALGRAARRTRIDTVYSVMTQGTLSNGPAILEGGGAKQLFATTHDAGANFWAAAGSTLTVAGLNGGKSRMRKMKGLRGEHINLTPRYLLVPAELESTALTLVTSETLIGTSNASGDKNIHQGTLKVIVEPRLDGATNGSTAWYLLTSPMEQELMVGVELIGSAGPVVEQKTPHDILGEGWWVYDDYGVAAVDPRGGFRSKGAA